MSNPMDYRCNECGSPSIYRETTASWCVASQTWVMSDCIEATVFCGECGHEDYIEDHSHQETKE